MKKKTQKAIDPDQLRFENELTKLELSLKTGAYFGTNPDASIPPEVERQFLKNIERFEEASRSAKCITIHEKIGKPELISPETLSDREVSEELKKINELLYENGISLDAICPVDDRTLYTFIADELMKEELQDMQIPGMVTHYIYEEFHPNHEYDIKEMVHSVTKYILNKEENRYENMYVKYIDNYSHLLNFTKSFEKFTIHHFNITAVTINDEVATANFEIKFTGYMESISGKVIFQGKGSATLECTNTSWWINHLELPI